MSLVDTIAVIVTEPKVTFVGVVPISIGESIMPKTISANDAKNRFGSALKYVSEQNDEVIVESYGKPRAVIMSMAAFEEVEALRERARREDGLQRLYEIRDERARNGTLSKPPKVDPERRAEALKRLHALREKVSARNQDLTEEQIEEIANRFSREIIDDMAAEGKIVFERDLRQSS